MAGQKEVAGYIQRAEEEKYAAKNSLSSKPSFIMEGETKSFPDKQKLKEFVTTKPALQEVLKGTLKGGKTEKKKYQKQQRLERTREHNQKLQLYRQHNGNKFIPFRTHSKRPWTKCSNQKI